MHLDELRCILLSERETGRLVQVPPDLFASTARDLAKLQEELYASPDPFSDEARVMIERVSAMRETLSDLFRIRAEKILALARTVNGGQYQEREEVKKMLPEEKELFDDVLLSLEQARCRLIEGKLPRPPGEEAAAAAGAGERCAAVLAEAAAVAHPSVLSRVLQDMEPFMGVDGRIYELRREDLVTLPERNAEVLCERNIVLRIG